MKITESLLRKIVKNALHEMYENDDIDWDNMGVDPEYQKEIEMQDMYDEYGNRSQYPSPAIEELYDDDYEEDAYKPGYLAMKAQEGNPDNITSDYSGDWNSSIAQDSSIWASKKPGVYRGISGERMDESKNRKNIKTITEKQIKNIVAESVKQILKENE